jgi:hypothetical protein
MHPSMRAAARPFLVVPVREALGNDGPMLRNPNTGCFAFMLRSFCAIPTELRLLVP